MSLHVTNVYIDRCIELLASYNYALYNYAEPLDDYCRACGLRDSSMDCNADWVNYKYNTVLL